MKANTKDLLKALGLGLLLAGFLNFVCFMNYCKQRKQDKIRFNLLKMQCEFERERIINNYSDESCDDVGLKFIEPDLVWDINSVILDANCAYIINNN